MPIPDSVYVPRDDETEAIRLQEMSNVGEVAFLTDEDIKRYSLQDMGVMFDDLP